MPKSVAILVLALAIAYLTYTWAFYYQCEGTMMRTAFGWRWACVDEKYINSIKGD